MKQNEIEELWNSFPKLKYSKISGYDKGLIIDFVNSEKERASKKEFCEIYRMIIGNGSADRSWILHELAKRRENQNRKEVKIMATFQFVQPTEEQKETMQIFRDKYEALAKEISSIQPTPNRGMALALTKLEESAFWLNKAITGNS